LRDFRFGEPAFAAGGWCLGMTAPQGSERGEMQSGGDGFSFKGRKSDSRRPGMFRFARAITNGNELRSPKFYVIWFGIEGNGWEEEESSKPGGCKRTDDSSRDFKKAAG